MSAASLSDVIRDSDHAAVLVDRDRLLEGYIAIVRWTGYQLTALAAVDLGFTIDTLPLDLPAAAIDDVLWSLHDARQELTGSLAAMARIEA